jgi:hypothetical protein
MSRHNYSAIFQQYRPLIAQMPDTFSSHEFILRLAQQDQASYIEALHTYRSDPDPFRIVHGRLSQNLHEHSDILDHLGEVNSWDIFDQSNRCAHWRKRATAPASLETPAGD